MSFVHFYRPEDKYTACCHSITYDLVLCRTLSAITCPGCLDSELYVEAQAQGMEDALTPKPRPAGGNQNVDLGWSTFEELAYYNTQLLKKLQVTT